MKSVIRSFSDASSNILNEIDPGDKNETASDGHLFESFGDRHLPSRFCHLVSLPQIDIGAIKFEARGKLLYLLGSSVC